MKPPKNKPPRLDMNRIDAFVRYYKRMHLKQKTGFLIGALVVLVLPIALFAINQSTEDRSQAAEVTNPPCQLYWQPDQHGACQKITHCSNQPAVTTTYKTESDCLDSLGVRCQERWWFDTQSTTCQQKKFCGQYMYRGLQTFSSENACQNALNNRP